MGALHALSPILHMIGLFAPILLLLLSYVFTMDMPFWHRSALILLGVLISLPLGFFLVLVGYDPRILTVENVNPGVGVVGVPVLLLWFACCALTVGWIIVLAVIRIFSKRS